MLCEKAILQNDSVFRAHNECMIECHEETGALGSYLAMKKQQDRSKDMHEHPLIRIPWNQNYHYKAGLN